MSNYRSPIRIINTDFTAGELDATLAMRHDTGILPSGAKSLKNMLVAQTGSASRRPGFINLVDLPARRRLVEFDYDIDEKYLCAFGHNVLNIYTVTGTLLQTFSGGTDCPWTSTTMWEFNFVHKGDVMIITHNDFRMRRLARTGATSFVLTNLAFSSDTGASVLNQPHFKYYLAAVTMGVSDFNLGTGKTLTCSDPIFTSAWVGDRVRIFGCEIEITAYLTPTTCTATVHQKVAKRLSIAPFRYTDGSGVVEVTHALHGMATGDTIDISGSNDDLGIPRADLNGPKVITVVDEDRYTVVAESSETASNSGDGGGPSVRISTTAKTRDWTEQVWSSRRGWPGAVTLHENRLWLGGSRGNPTYLSGSAVGAYYDHNARDGLDDESVQGLISTLERIKHLVSARTLQIFCEASEAIVETQNGVPITPANMKVTTQTNYGASDVKPLQFDGSTIFSQHKGRNIRELVYNYESESHVSQPISVRAAHLINSPRDMSVVQGTPLHPEQFAIVVNGDGTVAILQALRNEKLVAWTPMIPGYGLIDAVAVIPASLTSGPRIYFSVVEAGVYTLCMMDLDSTDIWLDFAKKLTGPSSTTWPLGAAYAGKMLSIMSNNNYLGKYAANGAGTLILPFSLTSIIAGYDYEIEAIPNPPDKELTDGPMTGEIRRIVSATIHWHESTAVAVNGMEQLQFNPISNPNTEAVRKSGKKRVRLLGYNRDPSIRIDQPTPGPLTLLGMSMEVSL